MTAQVDYRKLNIGPAFGAGKIGVAGVSVGKELAAIVGW